MFAKRKMICLLLTVILLLGLAACSQKPSSSLVAGGTQGGAAQPGGESQNTSNAEANPGSQAANTVPAKVTGKMKLIQLDDRDPSVLRGVTIKGNHAGSYDGINGKESSLTDVRCIFELSEWIEFYPDTDATYGLRVWILKHRDDQEYYNTAKFSDLDPNFANYCDLHYPADEDNPDEYPWGSFYLHPEECEPGYYDFVFTYEGKAIATLLTRFYNENELTFKSDAELEALMRE